ncbi:hypothetical protein [Aurantimonas aggregata]|uniref:hypothetical protein n=1 Tax=Aurantimonas aggregata TaxID=2047720 RepID=UPI001FECB5F5|nr:hypothetical protein [Aurantimonas aggregata]
MRGSCITTRPSSIDVPVTEMSPGRLRASHVVVTPTTTMIAAIKGRAIFSRRTMRE